MRALLIITAALLVALLLVRPAADAIYGLGWAPPAVDAGRCWLDFCVIHTNGYDEISLHEYTPPPPVVPNGAPYYP